MRWTRRVPRQPDELDMLREYVVCSLVVADPLFASGRSRMYGGAHLPQADLGAVERESVIEMRPEKQVDGCDCPRRHFVDEASSQMFERSICAET